MARSQSPYFKSRLAALAIGFGAVLILTALWYCDVGHRLELMAIDLQFKGRGRDLVCSPRIIHIDIDDESIREIGAWPFPRDMHGRVVHALRECEAEGLVLDVQFTEKNYSENEKRIVSDFDPERLSILADAELHRNRTLGMALSSFGKGVLVLPLADKASNAQPLPEYLKEFAMSIADQGRSWKCYGFTPVVKVIVQDAGSLGIAEIPTVDADGVVRRVPAVFRVGEDSFLQLGLRAALDHLQVEEVRWGARGLEATLPGGRILRIPTDEAGCLFLNWARTGENSFTVFTHVSYARVAEAGEMLEALAEIGELEEPEAYAERESKLASFRKELKPEGAIPERAKFEELRSVTQLEYKYSWLARRFRRNKLKRMFSPEHQLELARLNEIDSREQVADRMKRMSSLRAELKAAVSDSEFAAISNILNIEVMNSPESAEARRFLAEEFKREIAALTLQVKGKVCFLGSSAKAALDARAVPTNPFIPGVAIHSNVFNMVLTEQFLRQVSKLVVCAIVLGIGVISMSFATLFRWKTMLAGLLTIVIAYLFLARELFSSGWILPVAGPVLTVFLPTLVVLGFRYSWEERTKRQLREKFDQCMDPEIAEQLLYDQDFVKGNPHRVVATVMFTDIEGFSKFAEQTPPDETVQNLNEYLTELTDTVMYYKGYLNKYLGDGTMSIFGIKGETPESAAENACRAALEIQEKLRKSAGKYPFGRTRIGISTGTIIVGPIGGAKEKKRWEHTGIGDVVNVASRLQGMNKDLKTSILIEEGTFQLIQGKLDARPLGPQVVRGRAEPVVVYTFE
jgi:class 3 adenylate cyclase/CHASE2 domain-containing sensor protein